MVNERAESDCKDCASLNIGEQEDVELFEDCFHSGLAQNQQISSTENIFKIKDTENKAFPLFKGLLKPTQSGPSIRREEPRTWKAHQL